MSRFEIKVLNFTQQSHSEPDSCSIKNQSQKFRAAYKWRCIQWNEKLMQLWHSYLQLLEHWKLHEMFSSVDIVVAWCVLMDPGHWAQAPWPQGLCWFARSFQLTLPEVGVFEVKKRKSGPFYTGHSEHTKCFHEDQKPGSKICWRMPCLCALWLVSNSTGPQVLIFGSGSPWPSPRSTPANWTHWRESWICTWAVYCCIWAWAPWPKFWIRAWVSTTPYIWNPGCAAPPCVGSASLVQSLDPSLREYTFHICSRGCGELF